MSHDEVAAWEGFAVAMAGACAVLAGLVFVAVSINISRILQVRGVPGRAGESVILLLSALCLCAFVLVPEQSVRALGAELLVTGALTWMLLTGLVVDAFRRPSRQPRSWHLTRLLSVWVATVPAVLAGLSLLGVLGGELYWLVVAVLASVVWATTNAWVLLVEVVRDERYAPLDDDPDGRDLDRTHEARPA